MTDTEYLDRAEALLKAVELACDRLNDDTDADIDAQRVGGMVTLVFENRSQIVVNLSGEWYYNEYARGAGVTSVGGSSDKPAVRAMPAADERRSILDLFRN